MDNHLHFLLRIDVEQASQWSATEVARHWMALYPPRGPDRTPFKVTDEFLKLKADNTVWVVATRKRLSSLGWFLKCLKEPLARLANKQDGCTGAFFEGRYKSIAILDEEALVSVCPYIDLNPVGEGMREGFTLGQYLMLVDYTSRLVRDGKATMTAEVESIL